MKRILLLMFIIFFSFVKGYAIKDVKYWENLYNQSLDTSYWINLSESPFSLEHYTLGYGMDASVAMYEATNDLKYLDFAIRLANNVISTAKPICELSKFPDNSHCIFKGWDIGKDKNAQYPLYESYLFRYITKLLRVIKENPELINNPNYNYHYYHILNFTKENIWNKWYSQGLLNIFRLRTHMAAHWAYIALDLFIIEPNSPKSCDYYTVFSKVNFVGFIQEPNLASFSLRSQKPHELSDPQYFSWINGTWDPSTNEEIQDVSHANNVVSYIIESHENCIHWNYDDIKGLKSMLFNVAWNNETKTFNDCFNKKDDCFKEITVGIGQFQSDGWVKLGRYDIEIQEFYEDQHRQDLIINYLKKYSYVFYAHMAHNAQVLNNKKKYNCSSFITPHPDEIYQKNCKLNLENKFSIIEVPINQKKKLFKFRNFFNKKQ
ncbi:MAG: hypothetical protein M3Q58_15345 [Bacteroidota bacterium]|nr:hypothetical protein [Bacteroidota bacterium]